MEGNKKICTTHNDHDRNQLKCKNSNVERRNRNKFLIKQRRDDDDDG